MTLQKCRRPKFFITLKTNCHIVDTLKVSHQRRALMDQQNTYHSMNLTFMQVPLFVFVCNMTLAVILRCIPHIAMRTLEWLHTRMQFFMLPPRTFFYKCLFTNLALVRLDPDITFDFAMHI